MRIKPLLLALAVVAAAGCTSTITPQPVAAGQASYDGNDQTSGILSAHPNGYVVTPHFRDRWLALVKTYGRDFKPALTADVGWLDLADGTWLVDKQRMVYFLEMNAWLRARIRPQNP